MLKKQSHRINSWKKVAYNPHYNPDLLFTIPRKSKRDEIGVPDDLPFFGIDIWNHYEVS